MHHRIILIAAYRAPSFLSLLPSYHEITKKLASSVGDVVSIILERQDRAKTH